MDVGPACLWDGIEVFPDAVAGVEVETPQFAVAVHAVNVIALQDRSRYAAVQAVGLFDVLALSLPDGADGKFVGVKFEQQ